MNAAQLQPRRLADEIVERIELLILEGTFKPGERLPGERALAEEFGVSRPSLREALQKLVARGVLSVRHGGGTFVSQALGSTFRDPLLDLLEKNPESQRDLLEFRHTLEGACAYYAAQRATEPDRVRLTAAFERLVDCHTRAGKVDRAQEAAADSHFHLAIAEASHNAVLLHTIRSVFSLLEHAMLVNIGGLYPQGSAVRDALMEQHRELYRAIMEGRADDARQLSGAHLHYVRDVLADAREEAERTERAQRRRTPA